MEIYVVFVIVEARLSKRDLFNGCCSNPGRIIMMTRNEVFTRVRGEAIIFIIQFRGKVQGFALDWNQK